LELEDLALRAMQRMPSVAIDQTSVAGTAQPPAARSGTVPAAENRARSRLSNGHFPPFEKRIIRMARDARRR
jgi:hypothetical protein